MTSPSSPRGIWQQITAGWRPSENAVLLALAVMLGIATALGVWLFREGISLFQQIFRDGFLHTFAPIAGPMIFFGIIFVLAFAGLIVGLLVDRFIGEERHHGVAGIMEATALSAGRLRYRRMPLKAALASFSLGAGASVGPEDPSVQIGANLGSLFGQRFRLSDERVKLLVAAGAAAGISAAFRAPIAGVFFALEVILADFSTGSFGVVVLAAVVAAALTQAIEVGSPIFTEASIPELGIASYSFGGLQELPLYITLGILIAPISAVFIRMLYWQHDIWHHLTLPRPIKTMLAGALVGVIALFLPQIMGTGRETLNALLNQNSTQFTIALLCALAIAKIVATTMSLGGGFQGGMFAPSLFVGAAIGRMFGEISTTVFPNNLAADPAAFAIAGMAAAMTGVIRAPITAVMLLFELTDDYHLILPIMLTTIVCLFVVERLAPEGIYHLGLSRKGIRLSRGRDIDLMQMITVGEAMSPDVQTVPAALPASQLEAEFDKTNTHGLLVVNNENLLFGIITLQDLARARENNLLESSTVGDICTRNIITTTPDTPISEAPNLIGARDIGRLPIVASDNPQKPIGLLRRRDVVRAYELATQRKLDHAQRVDSVRLDNYSKAHIVELRIESGSPADKHLICEVKWPAGSVIATVRHKGQLLIPKGDTPLEAGDLLTVVTLHTQKSELARLVQSNDPVAKRTIH
jgi:CIC family chloride channel protein